MFSHTSSLWKMPSLFQLVHEHAAKTENLRKRKTCSLVTKSSQLQRHKAFVQPCDTAVNDTITRPVRTHLTEISYTGLFHKAMFFMPAAGQMLLHFEKPPPSAEHHLYTTPSDYKAKPRAGLKRQPLFKALGLLTLKLVNAFLQMTGFLQNNHCRKHPFPSITIQILSSYQGISILGDIQNFTGKALRNLT